MTEQVDRGKLALIAKLREAERERDEARWAAGIVGDVARESSGGWQDAAAELHATQARLWEAEAVIANVEDFVTRHYLDMRMGQAVLALTDAYKPTNQEAEQGETEWEGIVLGREVGGIGDWSVTVWRPDEIEEARAMFPGSEYVLGRAKWKITKNDQAMVKVELVAVISMEEVNAIINAEPLDTKEGT